jgi:hypothetical protein
MRYLWGIGRYAGSPMMALRFLTSLALKMSMGSQQTTAMPAPGLAQGNMCRGVKGRAVKQRAIPVQLHCWQRHLPYSQYV